MKILQSKQFDQRRIINTQKKLTQRKHPYVLITKQALIDMREHASGEMHHEIGGYLLGFPAKDEETRIDFTYIEKAVRADYESTPTYITLLPSSFSKVEIERKQNESLLVGYYHSHPNLSVFFSCTDKENFIQYHREDYQIAIVVDPSKYSEKDSRWIGFFYKNSDNEIKQIPMEYIIVTDQPLQKTDFLSIEENQNLKKSTLETIHALEEIKESLFRNPVIKNAPIIIIKKSLFQTIHQSNHPMGPEGLLVGSIDYLSGFSLISIIEFIPYALNHLYKINKDRKNQIFQYLDASNDKQKTPSKEVKRLIGLFSCSQKMKSYIENNKFRKTWMMFAKRNLNYQVNEIGIFCFVCSNQQIALDSTKAFVLTSQYKIIPVPLSNILIDQDY